MEQKNEVCWYIIHTSASSELSVRDNILKMVENNGLQDQIFDVKVLEEEEVVETNGKRKVVMKKKFPTYAFIKMIYSPHVYYKVTKIRGVTGFVGAGGHPEPLTAAEIRRMGLEKVKAEDLGIAEGDQVRIINGAFEGYFGEVSKIDAEAGVVEVILHMFGKPTPIKLEFNQVERA